MEVRTIEVQGVVILEPQRTRASTFSMLCTHNEERLAEKR